MASKIRSAAKLVLKVTVSAVALVFVFRNIDTKQLGNLVASVDPGWLAVAWITYNASKILSAERLTRYFHANHISINKKENLILYFIGMFYNLFLPGGIGGDAYKVWVLNRESRASGISAVQAVIYDRLSGMVLLGILGCLFSWLAFPHFPYRMVFIVGAVLALPLFFIVNRILASQFVPGFITTSILSAGVQGFQVICAYALLIGLGIDQAEVAYVAVFLLSSVVAVLPISIGGIGIRELVFITAADYAAISSDQAVAFSLLFFLVSAISSVPGGFLANPIRKPD
ncbi:MAG: flippase-like domain-containing protein [Cyclobacteriaceae bacterium]|nr:flippase-like domain-containing protein [Cyclobacteriaceae bacterium]